jgi:hypothetical protein
MDLPGFLLFDLANTPTRAVRAGYEAADLVASHYAHASAELRFGFPRIPLGPILSVSVAPFLYGDAALARTTADAPIRDLEGLGLGLRIGFEHPVFAFFSLSYGWNPDGRGRFAVFATTGSD